MQFWLRLDDPIKGSVRWSRKSGNEIILGIEFTKGQPWISAETIGHMIYGRSSRWARMRERYFTEMGLIGGLAYVVRLAVSGILRTTAALAAEPARRRRAAQAAQAIVVELEELVAPAPAFEDHVDPITAKIARAKEEDARRSHEPTGASRGDDPRFILPASMMAGQ